MRLFVIYSIFMLSCASIESRNKSFDPAMVPMSSKRAGSSSSSQESVTPAKIINGKLVDNRDGKTYKIVKIDIQTWMAENLNYKTKTSKCYNNDPENCKKYGRLYTWEEVRTACPGGWHLPNHSEWQMLVDYAGGREIAGAKLKANNGWNNFNEQVGNGSDDYGFSALAGGHGDYESKFSYMGDLGFWWSDNMGFDSEYASSLYINSRNNAKNNDFFGVYESYFSSIRCIKD